MNDDLVMFTLDGKCYHKVTYIPVKWSHGTKEYTKSECGLIDSATFNVHLEQLSRMSRLEFTARMRPCKKCYRKDKQNEQAK